MCWLVRDKYGGNLPTRDVLEHDLQRIASGEPIAYVIGWVTFAGCRIHVDQNVLIPRPETEWLVELMCREWGRGHSSAKPARIVDLGTGSGCVAIALAKQLHHVHITAIDLSKAALRVAQHNAVLNNVDISFVCSDWFANFPPTAQFDYIFCNPPKPKGEKGAAKTSRAKSTKKKTA
jgi:release factor glutamine methyltransferase